MNMKKSFLCLIGIIISTLAQLFFEVAMTETAIAALLTAFALLFTFYITSFSVYAQSEYLSKLYQITDKNDTSKTLLDTLLLELKQAVCVLYFSIIYLVIFLIFINEYFAMYLACPLWFVLSINFYLTYCMIDRYIDVVRQSAKIAGKRDK